MCRHQDHFHQIQETVHNVKMKWIRGLEYLRVQEKMLQKLTPEQKRPLNQRYYFKIYYTGHYLSIRGQNPNQYPLTQSMIL